MEPLLIDYLGKHPDIHPEAFIAPQVSVIGDVSIGKKSSVWFGCVIRGDIEPIRIGEGSNLQDGTIVHVTRGGYSTTIGDRVTVGHHCVLHACTLQDGSFVGMNATILDQAVVESEAMVAAGAVVTPGKVVRAGELWAGVPAKRMRLLYEGEIANITNSALNYQKHAAEYLEIFASL